MVSDSKSKEKSIQEAAAQLRAVMLMLSAPAEIKEIERVLFLASRCLPRLSRMPLPKLEKFVNYLTRNGILVAQDGKWSAADSSPEAIRQVLSDHRYKSLPDCIARAIPAIGNRGTPDLEYLQRDIRNAFYACDWKLLNASLTNLHDYFPTESEDGQGVSFLLDNPDWENLLSLPEKLLPVCAWQILPVAMNKLLDVRIIEKKFLELHQKFPLRPILYMIDYELLRGNFKAATMLIKHVQRATNNNVLKLRKAWFFSLLGRDEQAMSLFTDSLHEVRQEGEHDFYFQTVGGLFFLFSQLRTATPSSLLNAEANAELGLRNSRWGIVYQRLLDVVRYRRTQELPEELPDPTDLNPLQEFFWTLGSYWLASDLSEQQRDNISRIGTQAEAAGFDWLAQECKELLLRTGENKDTYSPKEFHPEYAATEVPFLLNCVQTENSWITRLKNFRGFLEGLPERSTRRLIWLVDATDADTGLLTVRPMEQHAIRNGKWSKGRKFTAFRNQNYNRIEQDLDSYMSGYQLTPQDKFACSILREALSKIEQDGSSIISAWGSVFLALIGHPRILLSAQVQRHLQCITASPYIRLLCHEHYYEFQLWPPAQGDEPIVLRLNQGDVITVYVFDNEYMQLRQLIGKEMRLPCDAQSQLVEVLETLCRRYQILSDCPLTAVKLPGEAAESKPEFRLIPENQGLRVELFVTPFGVANGYFKPGDGPLEMIAHQDNSHHRLVRDFSCELARAETAIEACPVLTPEKARGNCSWVLDNAEDCYEFTLQLREILDLCTVQWPENHKFSTTKTIGLGNLSLRTQNYKDWFGLQGTVNLGENKTISLQELLKRSKDERGRFIVLDDGQVVALSESFRQRLDEFNRLGEPQNDIFRIHPLLQPLLNALTGDVGKVEHAKEWHEQLERMEKAMQLNPKVPKKFKGTLRQYQVDGFVWMSRLDGFGAGACLADDMGLGKTIQAIAFILSKAAEGPALVIAPTSVCANWQAEFAKFAPDLQVVTLGSTERRETLAGMGPHSVLVTSYGLLQSENEEFARINWRVAVLDEAQAIKNCHAKRSRAALNINADFRLVTTGTPVENNLNELWSVFQFINPGLLGSRELFQQRFAIPIEREENREASQRLSKLIKPFLLRRRKDQVLLELPPKTDINHIVELSPEERQFYDTLRREILAELEGHRDGEGQMRIRVLAGITKLRLATCHPRLAGAGPEVPAAKLETFLELLEELLDGGHKTLVFSQFVKFLGIIREALDERQIPYLYLDGSLSAKERSAGVRAFQNGSCPVFLISLKAGGVGLNLTKADYVIHLDSWWNPAVENQASDRAHRIGQNKPVTIYHLLTRNTIEDKIQNLHQWKRDLADQILSGNDKISSISVEELLQLLAES